MAIHAHGTTGKYAQGCRCNLCELVHEATPVRTPVLSVPTRPARDHVNALRAQGWTVQAIADRSGYHPQTIRNIGNGKTQFTSRYTVEDICSIPIDRPHLAGLTTDSKEEPRAHAH